MSRRPRHAYAAQAWAQEQRVGHVGLKATLLLLAAYSDDEASCWPSQARIAEETEQDERTVRRHLEILREAGLVISGRRVVNGLRSSDRYWLQLDVTVCVKDIDAARTRVEAKARARRAARKALPDTVSGSQEDTVSGCLPDTGGVPTGHPMSGCLPDIGGVPTGHLMSDEVVEDIPSGCTSTTEELLASKPASSTAPDETPADVAALRRAITAGGHGVVSWRGLTAPELTELAGLVAIHGITAMAARADHQARQRGGPPGHVRAWLPEWRDLVPPAAPEPPAARLRSVPEAEGHRVGPGQLRALIREQHTGGAA